MIIMTRDDDDGDDIHSNTPKAEKEREINSATAAVIKTNDHVSLFVFSYQDWPESGAARSNYMKQLS